MLWREFTIAAQALHGENWRGDLALELHALFGTDIGMIARWDECRETIPLHVELMLRSRLQARGQQT